MEYHMISFFGGFLLDLMLGDPHFLPHPIRWIGSLVAYLEKVLQNPEKNQENRGRILVMLVLLLTGVSSFSLLFLSYRCHAAVGIIVESVMTYQVLAMKCLKKESTIVYKKLAESDLAGARQAVAMIVGRDTAVLNEAGITKAAVETIAENSSDGVIAPMLYLAFGGPVLGLLYKAVNTMDSMIGYKNEKYLAFGRTAALLDDAVNYIPARITARLMILAAYLLDKDFNGKNAGKVYKKDRYKHASPNSAHPEAACAGALGIQLAGDAIYSGKVVKKPLIGDAQRPVEYQDIIRANRLLYVTAYLFGVLCFGVMAGIWYLLKEIS